MLKGNQISGSAGGNITLRTGGDVTIAGGLNIATGPLQFAGSGGTAGQVLTSAGTSSPPTWSPATSITSLTGDVVASGPGSAAATVTGVGGSGSPVHYVVEGGKYASLQAAVDTAVSGSTILVGPKTTGDWGNVTIYGNKNLLIGALGGSQPNKVVKIGSVTYAVYTSGSLNVNQNEVFLNGLYIQGSFADAAVVLSGSLRAGRLRLVDCYVDNTNGSGLYTIKNLNNVANSSLYIDDCVVSNNNDASGITVFHSGTYTTIKNRADISGGQYALSASMGTVEIFDSYLEVNKPNAAVAVSGVGTYVSVGYSTVRNLNTANSALAVGATVGAGAFFGAGDSTISVGSVPPPGISSGSAVTGAGIFAYGSLTFGYVTAISATTVSPAYQAGGVFTQGIGVGLLSQFSVSSAGNVTGSNAQLTGDIAVNGGDITTTATTFNLVNTTATTLNVGGAATSLTLGATPAATTTIRGGTLVGNQTTQAVFNTTATTVNAFGAATSLTMGATPTATTTLRGGTLVGDATTQNAFNTVATTVNFAGAASTALNIGNSAGTNTVSGATKFNQGLSGSHTKLVDGTNYLLAGGGGILLSTGSNGAVTITGGGGSSPYNSYTTTVGSPFSLTIPTNCNFIEMEVCGGGGGAGSGKSNLAGNGVFGGGGGSGGSRTYYSVKADTIRTLGSSLSITIGGGGSGGVGISGATTGDGNSGNNGNPTFIQCAGTTIIYASGGLGGTGGTATNGLGAAVVRWRDAVLEASGSSSSNTTTPSKPWPASFAGAGGAGGGVSVSSVAVFGGAGGRGGDFYIDATDRAGTGGSSAGVSGGAASAGTHSPTGGGGGGGGAGHQAGNGGAGGAGVQGSGGGGGGGIVNIPGNTSGAGGAGGTGWAVVRFS